MRSEALAQFDAEMRRFGALTDEERIAELNAEVNESVGDAVRRQMDVSGSVRDAVDRAMDVSGSVRDELLTQLGRRVGA